ncbi:HEPN domain-containing protein [Sorangium sp. So ce1097]|uniref:HEPN domain-containing protein n=1 Tax=Sorangium sp. So ce1097 TaxID=3133330 RepID=UPI003F622CF1
MRQALADFGTSLNRIRALANGIVAATGAALANTATRELHETQQCGAVVLMTGYFEAFLKDLVRRFIEDLSLSGLAFSGLPEAIRNRHFEGGGKVLTKASEFARKGKPTPFGNATREDIVARLHSASNAGAPYQIVWEAFADTHANPGPDVVQEIAQWLGLKKVWPTISTRSGDPARWSDGALTAKLADLIAKRNACAHTGTVSPIPTASDILDFADMLQALGTGLVAALEAELAIYKASVAAAAVPPVAGGAPAGPGPAPPPP